MMDVLVVGEGVTETGHETVGEYPNVYTAVCPALVENIASQIAREINSTSKPFKVKRICRFSQIPVSNEPHRIAGKKIVFTNPPAKKKIAAAILLARAKGCTGVIVQHDRERPDGPDFYAYTAEVIASAAELLPANGFVLVINPLRSIETWLLVDSNAVLEVCGVSRKTGLFSGSPEDRPNPTELKNELLRLSDQCGIPVSEIRTALAAKIDKVVLENQCPICSTPFILQCRSYLVD